MKKDSAALGIKGSPVVCSTPIIHVGCSLGNESLDATRADAMNFEERNDNLIWQHCPFRIERKTAEDAGSGSGPVSLICGTGGVNLTAAHGSNADAVCKSCDIPSSLLKKQACLYLVPFRIFGSDNVQSYYGCRWFLDIPPRNVPRNNDWCRACTYWFPRPPEHMIPNAFEYSRKARALFMGDPDIPFLAKEKSDTRSDK